MHVVALQDVGVDLASMLVASRFQFFQIEAVVGIRAEYFAAIVAAHDDVLRMARDDDSRQAKNQSNLTLLNRS